MNRKIYDLFENEIRKNNTKYTIYYVKCDCHNLAIRQKGCVNFFDVVGVVQNLYVINLGIL